MVLLPTFHLFEHVSEIELIYANFSNFSAQVEVEETVETPVIHIQEVAAKQPFLSELVLVRGLFYRCGMQSSSD